MSPQTCESERCCDVTAVIVSRWLWHHQTQDPHCIQAVCIYIYIFSPSLGGMEPECHTGALTLSCPQPSSSLVMRGIACKMLLLVLGWCNLPCGGLDCAWRWASPNVSAGDANVPLPNPLQPLHVIAVSGLHAYRQVLSVLACPPPVRGLGATWMADGQPQSCAWGAGHPEAAIRSSAGVWSVKEGGRGVGQVAARWTGSSGNQAEVRALRATSGQPGVWTWSHWWQNRGSSQDWGLGAEVVSTEGGQLAAGESSL